MERSRIKLAILFLLVVVNLFLLGLVAIQHNENVSYEKIARVHTMTYLEQQGIQVKDASIPWKSTLPTDSSATAYLLPGYAAPKEGFAIQSGAQAATLLIAFGAQQLCGNIQNITEYYAPAAEGTVLHPVWLLETDAGAFLLDGVTREVSPYPTTA